MSILNKLASLLGGRKGDAENQEETEDEEEQKVKDRLRDLGYME